MTRHSKTLGLGCGWRPEIARTLELREELGFVEVVAENIRDPRRPPEALLALRERGIAVIPHGISLSLGGTEPVDPKRVAHLARLAENFDSPLASEHIAFCRAGGRDAGHLTPVPRTRPQLDVLIANIRATMAILPVPFAVENIAALFEWPEADMDESEFLAELLDATGALFLLDVANLWANARNFGRNVGDCLAQMPTDRIAYAHVGGGEERDGIYHDTHAHAVPAEVFATLEHACARAFVPGAMLERDDAFPGPEALNAELDAISRAWRAGTERRADAR